LPIFSLKGQSPRSPDVKYHKMTHAKNQGPCGDLTYCQRLRRSTAGRTAAYHVGIKRLHLFLFTYS